MLSTKVSQQKAGKQEKKIVEYKTTMLLRMHGSMIISHEYPLFMRATLEQDFNDNGGALEMG
eukprot:scaffold324665_cov58-Tisochrysis_lutea.AAC.2